MSAVALLRSLGRRGWEAVKDRANPILVRSLRQEMRNRVFFGVFTILLLVSCGAAIIVATLAGSQQADGSHLFAVLAAALSFATVVVQPSSAYHGIVRERDEDTWNLIELTGMRPWRLVRGMVAAALVQGSYFTAGIAPFMLMAFLLRGIDLISLLLLLVLTVAGGVVLSCFAVFLGTIGNHKVARAILGVVLLLGLFLLYGFSIALFVNIDEFIEGVGWMMTRDPGGFWLVIAILANTALAAALLSLALGASRLTHVAEDRSTGPRLAWILIYLDFLAWVLSIGWFQGNSSLMMSWSFGLAGVVGVAWFLIYLAFAAAEDDTLSVRQLQVLQRRRRWRLGWLLGCGPANGIFGGLVCLAVAVLVGLPALDEWWSVDEIQMLLASGGGILAYGLIVIALADLLGRRFLSRWLPTPGARRALILVVLAGLGVICGLGWLLWAPLGPVINWVNPFTGIVLVANAPSGRYPFSYEFDSDYGVALPLVGLAASLSLYYLIRRAIRHYPAVAGRRRRAVRPPVSHPLGKG